MGNARYIGRVATLTVALGIGAGLASTLSIAPIRLHPLHRRRVRHPRDDGLTP
jgi:hypothetical protein